MIDTTSDYNGRFTPNNFHIGSTVSSKCIPVISLLSVENLGDAYQEYIYYKPVLLRDVHLHHFDWRNISNRLSSYASLYLFTITENLKLYVGKNYIVDTKDNILLTLCQKKFTNDYIYRIDNLVLLVSRRLILDKECTVLYKKLEREYIMDAHKKGIEVRFVDEGIIEKECFSNEFEMNFGSITELNTHLNTAVQHLPYARDAHFAVNYPAPMNINPIVRVPPFDVDAMREILAEQGRISIMTNEEHPTIEFVNPVPDSFIGYSTPMQGTPDVTYIDGTQVDIRTVGLESDSDVVIGAFDNRQDLVGTVYSVDVETGNVQAVTQPVPVNDDSNTIHVNSIGEAERLSLTFINNRQQDIEDEIAMENMGFDDQTLEEVEDDEQRPYDEDEEDYDYEEESPYGDEDREEISSI